MNKTDPLSLFTNLRCRLCAKEKPCDNRMQNLAHNENSKKSFVEKLKYFGGEFYEFFGNFDNKLLPETVCGTCCEGLEASHKFFLHMENAKKIFSKFCKNSGQSSDKKSLKTDIKIKSEYTNDTLNINPINENDKQIKVENDIINEYDNYISIEVNDIKIEASDDTMMEQNCADKISKCVLLQPIPIKKETVEPVAGDLVKGSDPVLSPELEQEPDTALTQPEISMQPQHASDDMLSPNSKARYLATYETFIQWKNSKNAQSFSENVLMAYFNELGTKYSASSLWCIYSMLRNTIKAKNNIDIKPYSNLLEFLKKRSDGYVGRKSKVLLPADVEKFLNEAPDNQYLAVKVALIFGVTGACRRQELCDITTDDVVTHGEMLLVKISNNRNKIPRSFTIDGPFYEIVKKYEALRPTNVKNNRYFLNFQKGKCTAQPIGINKFGTMPREIAKYLNLPDSDTYTGHSFRRTSATLLADSGADILTSKRLSGWRSDAAAEPYIENSIHNKTSAIHLEPQRKKFCPEPRQSTFLDIDFSVSSDLTNDNDNV